MNDRGYFSIVKQFDPEYEKRKQAILETAQMERKTLLKENLGYATTIIEQLLEYAMVSLQRDYGLVGGSGWPDAKHIRVMVTEYILKELSSIYGIRKGLGIDIVQTPRPEETITIKLTIEDPCIQTSVGFSIKERRYVRIPDDIGEDKSQG